MKICEKEIFKVIQDVLNLKDTAITLDSSMGNVQGWDSLGHIAILLALDRFFGGKVSPIRKMATADSVRKILQILRANSLM